MAMYNKIDFVITWVDDSDPKWRKEFEYYSAIEGRVVDNNVIRYRDWGTLRYWFRSVEKFAPWVNKIYFVTYGHLPKWLNVNNPKLVIVKHEDFIPSEYLPTFSSDAIEFFFHKIKGLSDRFVYFNDDMFLIDHVSPERFFKNGLPCDIGALAIRRPDKILFSSTVFMSIGLINANFNKKAVLHKNMFKWYNFAYVKASLCNLLCHRFNFFPGFVTHHIPQGFLKQTFDEVWSKCEDDLIRTCSNKFRSYGDAAFWLIRYWQLASGNFSPYNVFKDGKFYRIIDEDISEIVKCIRSQQLKLLCLNDNFYKMDYEENKRKIIEAFNSILPNPCSFEK